MCVGIAGPVKPAQEAEPRKGSPEDRHTTSVTSAPESKITAALPVEILRNLSNLYSRSGRKGRWRDGDGWERLENLAIIRHQRYLQILGEGHKFAIVGRTT